jgi:long-chain acyl-CoA synthetase
MTVGMLMSMSIGAEQVIMKEFHRKDFCQLIGKYGVTYTFLVPPMFIALVNYPDLVGYDWSSLRFAANGAAPISPDVARKFQELTGVTVYHQWGLTEASPVVAANPWEKIKIESQGVPLSDTEHKVIDPQTFHELPIGEVGELVVKGPQVMKGYWNRPDETEEAFVTIGGENWLRTGDIARIDEEGYEYIIDRLKETIKYKGFSVSPNEIEKLLFTHPAIADCAVVGKPDSYAGEIPKAFVVPKPGTGVTSEDIVDFVKPRIAEYKWIREVEFVGDIPRTPSGKILRKALVERERTLRK